MALLVQFGCSVAIFVACFSGSMVPVFVEGRGASPRLKSVFNCLAAGLLLGASVCHLLVDAEEQSFEYPLQHLLAGLGFLMVLVMERVLFAHDHAHAGGDSPGDVELVGPPEEQPEVPLTTDAVDEEHKHSHAEGAVALVLFAVLGLESFVSGVAMGIQKDNKGVLVLFIAVITHIWAESFALTTTFFKAKFSKKKAIWLSAAFAAVTPAGIAFGVVLGQFLDQETGEVVTAIFVALAAGIFLYVAIIEVIAEEFSSQADKWVKTLATFSGYLFMALIAVWW